jgi:glycerophosphoryl diester phosphodiesterase
MVSGMLVLAHRGANRLEPENTVPAMTAAMARNADGVEVDVHRTADGALVVRHDADTPTGLIGDLTLGQLHESFPDVPVLATVLDVCEGGLVNVEVKDSDPRATEALIDLLAVRSAGGSDDVLVSSFDLATIDRVRAFAPHLPTGFLSSRLRPDEMLVRAVDHGHTAVHPEVWTLTTVDVGAFVTRAHDAGLQVNVWTVNEPNEVVALRDAGVDAVITDDAALYGYGVRGRRR